MTQVNPPKLPQKSMGMLFARASRFLSYVVVLCPRSASLEYVLCFHACKMVETIYDSIDIEILCRILYKLIHILILTVKYFKKKTFYKIRFDC